MPGVTIGIDVGGTNIKAGVVDAGGAAVVRREIETEAARGFEHVFQRLTSLANELRGAAGQPVSAIGIGVPGPLSHARGVIHRAPNLPGWVNVPMRDRFSAATGLPVCLENDANAAAFGEFVAGAGRALRDLVMLTLGTGIGGGVILDGRLWRGSFDNAGEIGHMIVLPGGRECPCGQRGCLERYASANAVAERAAEALRAGERSALSDPFLQGQRAGAGGGGLTAADVEGAATEGDALASRVWEEMCRCLAIACVNIQHLYNPQAVILAGGLINAGGRLLEPVRRCFDALTWTIAPDRPRIELAELGGNAGLIGAAALARIEFG